MCDSIIGIKEGRLRKPFESKPEYKGKFENQVHIAGRRREL
jgi:hypothetical protein